MKKIFFKNKGEVENFLKIKVSLIFSGKSLVKSNKNTMKKVKCKKKRSNMVQTL